LEDSGPEMAVISASVVHQLDGVVPMGHVLLSGISSLSVQTLVCANSTILQEAEKTS